MITKRDPDSEFWTAAREASERVEQWPAWKRGVLERPVERLRTTINIPIRQYTRVSLRNSDYGKLCVIQGHHAASSTEQPPLMQAHVNDHQYCHMELHSLLSAMRECQKWHEQARKQRGLG